MSGTVAVLPTGRIAVGRSDGIIDIWGSQSRTLSRSAPWAQWRGRGARRAARWTAGLRRQGQRHQDLECRPPALKPQLARTRRDRRNVVRQARWKLASSATDGDGRVWDLRAWQGALVLERPDGDVYGMSWMWGDHIGSGSEMNRLAAVGYERLGSVSTNESSLGDVTLRCGFAARLDGAVPLRRRAALQFERQYALVCSVLSQSFRDDLHAVSNRRSFRASLRKRERAARYHEVIVWDIFKRQGLRFNHRQFWPTGDRRPARRHRHRRQPRGRADLAGSSRRHDRGTTGALARIRRLTDLDASFRTLFEIGAPHEPSGGPVSSRNDRDAQSL